ncbi:uncharacterized protein LOC131426283 [Malaya genurostris]|uniref:uncharacterized protein LOC131426283 n=1 Tax=Malaya genurostris TaxID=325434 RepID=UPI0026F3D7D1|nr:uncharacterized protein LOC131426283 [Malaya genurostris]XP_058444876.1 uncharacterized protein LOC131426283 [Malaya genurostris]XP_058444877.1 uncharacterized protein LOC131426283 [Malaya genurostris]XP_058444878.1 uncharacterized protein LOC131426283 [Malaya genurostris]XP_058444879.1 uncharacterized protein LOC131426283 [Malaya genurostris]XP_058444880.1 uncharacterized protein LOC131426283 [Malaya genurostris]XP_058444881.1 uncharacterized protein LOC131426283 [Malaya genurostris]XP_0
MQHLSILTAGWSYIPAGLTFGYLLMLPSFDMYLETMYWPFIVAIITLIISVALTNGLKLNYRKCQFVHLYVQLVAMLFYLAAGLIFLLVTNVVPAIYLASCGLGLTLVSGLSYIHIRAPGRFRSLYMSLCYVWFLAGVAATATVFLVSFNLRLVDYKETVHTRVAICMLSTSFSVIILVAINEMLQREAIVDYKKPLDFDTDIAHESGKLMRSRSESTNLYNNFTNSAPTLTNGGAVPKQWNSSTERIILRDQSTKKNYHNLWVFYMIFTKFQGIIAFYWIFLRLGMEHSVAVFDSTNAGYTIFWFMVLGSLIGTLSMTVLGNKIIFLVASILHTIGLILAVSFNYTNTGNMHVGISMIVFYTFIGASLVIPAINILELSPLNFNESFLAIGTIMELIGIALIQYFGETESAITYKTTQYNKDIIAAHFITMIVLSVLLAIIVIWHMPDTYKKSLAEIHSDMARMTSYFAFVRMMDPIINNHQPVTRAFRESITSEQPEVDEKQLSTRNGHLAVVSQYSERRSDESMERRSPYNDFTDPRYNRRPVPERDFTPTPERDDPYLQEQLQRQHERNYILSRQQQILQRARESPEHVYRPERQPENHYQHRPYNAHVDDYNSERPRSSNSQTNRHGPPLLARQQYYEQFNQERPQPPLPKPSPVHHSPVPSSRELNNPSPMLIRHSKPSQTVKSEPGFVSRPRLQTQQSEAPAPPPLPPADYLTKSLPRIRPERASRETIHPVLVPKPSKPPVEIVPGVEYTSNLRPSEFLRQSRQSMFFRESTAPPDAS